MKRHMFHAVREQVQTVLRAGPDYPTVVYGAGAVFLRCHDSILIMKHQHAPRIQDIGLGDVNTRSDLLPEQVFSHSVSQSRRK